MTPTLPRHTRLEAGLLPRLGFSPSTLTFLLELLVPLAQILDSLLSEQLFKRPFLNVLRLVLLELLNVLNRTLEDRALVLLAAGDNLGELVDPLVYGLSASPLDLLVVVPSNPVPFLGTDLGLGVGSRRALNGRRGSLVGSMETADTFSVALDRLRRHVREVGWIELDVLVTRFGIRGRKRHPRTQGGQQSADSICG